MLEISDADLQNRMRFDNPWWGSGVTPEDVAGLPERDYFPPFLALARERSLRRAVVLLGPRRVGKTIMMQQAVKALLASGAASQNLLYLSLDTPLFSGVALEHLLNVYLGSYGGAAGEKTVFFDEIQYLKDWEIHLKSLVDSYKDIKFVASGSAAAALSRGSKESGAGRFTEFLLPPLTFAEFLRLTKHPLAARDLDAEIVARIGELNAAFVDYLNYGGYPELALSEEARRNPARYIGQDIVEKVLLRDLPSLYGIQDVQELQHLFKVLAFNTGQEVSLDGLSKNSHVAKNTLKRYIEYLEAAFLVRTVDCVDMNAHRFQRTRNFKVYLTNPCLHTALFGPIREDDDVMGEMAETAIYAQWFHDPAFGTHLRYARDKDGEIDVVYLWNEKPNWIVEIKWSDLFFDRPGDLKSVLRFTKRHNISFPENGEVVSAKVTTKTKTGIITFNGAKLYYQPTSLYCLILGHNTSRHAVANLFPPAPEEDDGQEELPL